MAGGESLVFPTGRKSARDRYLNRYIVSAEVNWRRNPDFTDEELDSIMEYMQNKESDKNENKKNTEDTISELLWFICLIVIVAGIFSIFA